METVAFLFLFRCPVLAGIAPKLSGCLCFFFKKGLHLSWENFIPIGLSISLSAWVAVIL